MPHPFLLPRFVLALFALLCVTSAQMSNTPTALPAQAKETVLFLRRSEAR